MATITITDEATRQVLARVLWNKAVNALHDCANHTVWADQSEDDFTTEREEIEGRVSEYQQWTGDLRAVEALPIGSTYEITPEMASDVRMIRQVVDENPADLLNASPSERERMLALYDAAYALLPAEAVTA